jgi:hypothetical protein
MPALFAYLLAIGIFVGCGYAGLHWLANPPNSGPMRHRASSQHAHLPSPRNMRQNSTVQASDAPPPTSAERAPESSWAKARSAESSTQTAHGTESGSSQTIPSQTESQKGSERESAKEREASNESNVSNGDVSRSGCKPIGLTAQGQLVFPMECREFLALHRDPDSSRAQSDASHQASGSEQWSVTSDRQPQQLQLLDNQAVSVRTGSAPRVKAQPISQSGDKVRRTRLTAKKMDGTPKEHSEPPMSPSRTIVSQLDEWFNAFGLR